ncbi:hypothetical protein KEM54_006886 [Ascosphaera aggregata]|nr:hypothetical protein KEM54_006886 [Ascosphaera aggregata]
MFTPQPAHQQQPGFSFPTMRPPSTGQPQPFTPHNFFPQFSAAPLTPSMPQMPAFTFPPPGSHINPAFFRGFQQPQQMQQQNQQPSTYGATQQPQQQQQQQQPHYGQQGQTDAFVAAQAQLDILKRLSNAGGSGGQS